MLESISKGLYGFDFDTFQMKAKQPIDYDARFLPFWKKIQKNSILSFLMWLLETINIVKQSFTSYCTYISARKALNA